jgi:hypothetical protein
MSRNQHREHPGGASEHRMRFGALVLSGATLTISTLLMLSPAIAEVCDKIVGDNWRSEDSPASVLHLIASLPIGFVLLGGLALVAIGKLRWLGCGAATILVLMTAFTLVDMIEAPE